MFLQKRFHPIVNLALMDVPYWPLMKECESTAHLNFVIKQHYKVTIKEVQILSVIWTSLFIICMYFVRGIVSESLSRKLRITLKTGIFLYAKKPQNILSLFSFRFLHFFFYQFWLSFEALAIMYYTLYVYNVLLNEMKTWRKKKLLSSFSLL